MLRRAALLVGRLESAIGVGVCSLARLRAFDPFCLRLDTRCAFLKCRH